MSNRPQLSPSVIPPQLQTDSNCLNNLCDTYWPAGCLISHPGTDWLFHPQVHPCPTFEAARNRCGTAKSMYSQVSWREFTEEYNGSFTIHLPCLAPIREVRLAFQLQSTWGRVGTHLQVSPNIPGGYLTDIQQTRWKSYWYSTFPGGSDSRR